MIGGEFFSEEEDLRGFEFDRSALTEWTDVFVFGDDAGLLKLEQKQNAVKRLY